MHMHTHRLTHMHMYTQTDTHMHMHTQTDTHMHMHTHRLTHTCTCTHTVKYKSHTQIHTTYIANSYCIHHSLVVQQHNTTLAYYGELARMKQNLQ